MPSSLSARTIAARARRLSPEEIATGARAAAFARVVFIIIVGVGVGVCGARIGLIHDARARDVDRPWDGCRGFWKPKYGVLYVVFTNARTRDDRADVSSIRAWERDAPSPRRAGRTRSVSGDRCRCRRRARIEETSIDA